MRSIKKPSSAYILKNGALMYFDPSNEKTTVLTTERTLFAPAVVFFKAENNPNTIARLTNIRYK